MLKHFSPCFALLSTVMQFRLQEPWSAPPATGNLRSNYRCRVMTWHKPNCFWSGSNMSPTLALQWTIRLSRRVLSQACAPFYTMCSSLHSDIFISSPTALTIRRKLYIYIYVEAVYIAKSTTKQRILQLFELLPTTATAHRGYTCICLYTNRNVCVINP